MAAQLFRSPADPRQSAPVGSYLTDGHCLLEVLETDYARVLCENVHTGYLLTVGRVELAQGWRRVRPAGP